LILDTLNETEPIEGDDRVGVRRGAGSRPRRASKEGIGDESQVGSPEESGGGFIMSRTVHGKIHGKTIELDEDPGLAEGQDVQIILKVVRTQRAWGEGILRTAGALADDPYWDDIMEEIYQDRKRDRRPQMEDQ
jgi:hypothetical protein